jgi:hypothetical protein
MVEVEVVEAVIVEMAEFVGVRLDRMVEVEVVMTVKEVVAEV